jgi:hypothetical protein
MASLGRDLTRRTIPTLVQRAQQGYRMADLRGFSFSLCLLFCGRLKNPFEPLMIVEPEISRCRRSTAGTDVLTFVAVCSIAYRPLSKTGDPHWA